MKPSKRVVVLIDTSGSVYPFRDVLVKSTNAALQFLYKLLNPSHEEVVVVDIFTFNQTLTQIVYGCALGYFAPRISLDDVVCGDGTALYDSIGTILSLHEKTPWDVLMVVTDGCDTFSEKYTQEQIRDLINSYHSKPLSERNIRFLYISVGVDAQQQGDEMGFYQNESIAFNHMDEMAKPESSQKLAFCLSQALTHDDVEEEAERPQKQFKHQEGDDEEEIEASQYF